MYTKAIICLNKIILVLNRSVCPPTSMSIETLTNFVSCNRYIVINLGCTMPKIKKYIKNIDSIWLVSGVS